MDTPREDDTQKDAKRGIASLPTLKGGPFPVDISDRGELFRLFDEEDETLRPFFTREDPPR